MKLHTWLTDGLERVHPHSLPGRNITRTIAARGERLSLQFALRIESRPLAGRDLRSRIRQVEQQSVLPVSVACQADSGLSVRVRRIGYVPVPHFNLPVLPGHSDGVFPGYVGDPLFEESSTKLWPGETQAFWLTVTVEPDCPARLRKLVVAADFGADSGVSARRSEVVVDVRPVTIQASSRRGFAVTNWFYADALLDWYKLDGFTPRFWRIAEAYFRNVVAHGQDTLYVPVFTPPLDGVKRPTQLLKVASAGAGLPGRAARYHFDWADVRRWVRLARQCGVRHLEFNHLFTQWGAANAIRIYHGQGEDERLLWPAQTPAAGAMYRRFLAQYLPQLERFCLQEGIFEDAFFHLSDEPHGAEHLANYARARAMLVELAPWMKTMDALSEIEFARKGLVDMPVPSIRTTMQFVRAGIPSWTYFCCGPRGQFLQRLMDTPLAKIRAGGWLFYRTAVGGFLHWGYNYWYKRQSRELIDPFTLSDGGASPGWAYGDPFVVYPGQDAPVDSVRWEVFADSLGDYALLATLGVDRDAALLADFRDYDDFPITADFFRAARRRLLGKIG